MRADEFQIKANGNVEASISLSKVVEGLADGNYDLQVDALLGGTVQTSSPVINIDKNTTVTIPKDESIIRFYRFNEISGDAVDESGNSDGIVNGSMTRDGSTYTGNGTNAYVDGGTLDITDSFSIAFRYTTGSDVDATEGLITTYDSPGDRNLYIIQLEGNLRLDSNQSFVNIPVSPNTTYEVVMTMNPSGNLIGYESKTVVGTDAGEPLTTYKELNIFRRNDDAIYSSGKLDYIAIWNVELTQTDIDEIPSGTI